MDVFNIIHCQLQLCQAGVVDLSPGPGELCRACCEKRIKYLGVTITSKHTEGLRENMVRWLKDQTLRVNFKNVSYNVNFVLIKC